MTLADLEKFVTGPAIYKRSSVTPQQPQSPLGQKRKPEDYGSFNNEDQQLYHVTVTKLFDLPRKKSEPPLRKILQLTCLMRQLQYKLSSSTPCKRINLDTAHCDVDDALNDQSRKDAGIIGPSAALHNLHIDPNSDTRYTELVMPSLQSTLVRSSADSKIDSNLPSPVTKEQSLSRSEPGAEMHVDEAGNPSTVLNSPTEMVDNALLPTFDSMDFESLVQCSLDQYGAGTTSRPPGHVDELDSIMQVLVSM